MSGKYGTIHDVETPAILVDRQALEKNIQGMQKAADDAGARLAPHIKTHKCLQIAKMQVAAGAKALTCAKLSEAEALAEASPEWFIAYPIIVEAKLARLANLNKKVRTRVSLESVEGADILEKWCSRTNHSQDVMIKVESGLKRTGVELGDLEAFLNKVALRKRINPVGIFTHEGKAYGSANTQEARGFLDGVQKIMQEAGAIFKKVFGKDPILSPGCSVTALYAKKSDGFSELRPGAYVFGDTSSVHIGIYPEERCALRMITTIVSLKPDGRVIVDAGTKTLSSDRHSVRKNGIVVGHPDFDFLRLTEEHGILSTKDPSKFKIGDRLQIIPAHVCPVLNLHNFLYIREGENILDRWPIEARGCVY
jgi:D-serine deaminase-like pyridoxal phosphate-dependent protein